MNNTFNPTRQNQLRKYGLFALAALVIAATLAYCNAPISWNEEVQLQSGEVIVVHRTVKTSASGVGIGDSDGWVNKGMAVTIRSPKKADNPPEWSDVLDPLIFDRDPETQKWFMVAVTNDCKVWYDIGRPPLPYLQYHIKNGAWQREALDPKYIGREGNMLTNIHAKGEQDFTLARKAERMGEPAFRLIKELTKVVSKSSSGC
jgi:hypothetical protein